MQVDAILRLRPYLASRPLTALDIFETNDSGLGRSIWECQLKILDKCLPDLSLAYLQHFGQTLVQGFTSHSQSVWSHFGGVVLSHGSAVSKLTLFKVRGKARRRLPQRAWLLVYTRRSHTARLVSHRLIAQPCHCAEFVAASRRSECMWQLSFQPQTAPAQQCRCCNPCVRRSYRSSRQGDDDAALMETDGGGGAEKLPPPPAGGPPVKKEEEDLFTRERAAGVGELLS